jgi:hypothetical protein
MPTALLSQLITLLSEANRSGGVLDMPPLPIDEIEPLQERAMESLGHRLPDAYIEFLTVMDGAYIGALLIAGSRERPLRYANGREHQSVSVPDMVTEIEEMEWDSNLLLIVNGELKRGWNPDTNEWVLVSLQLEPFRTYSTFEELLADAMWEVSIDTRPLMPTTFAYFALDDDGNKVFGKGTA